MTETVEALLDHLIEHLDPPPPGLVERIVAVLLVEQQRRAA